MTMQEGLWGGTVGRPVHDRAYFLDLLGDSHIGLGRHKAAIEALYLGRDGPARSLRQDAADPPQRRPVVPAARPAETLSPYRRDHGRFVLCPGPTESRAG